MIEFGSKGTISRTEALDAYIAFSASYIIAFLRRVGIAEDVCEGLEKVALTSLAMLDDPQLVTEFAPDIFEVYLTAKGYTITDE